MTNTQISEIYESGIIPADIVPSVSYSSLSKLMDSAQDFHAEYVEGIRLSQTMDMIFGKRIHSMIGMYHGKIFESSDSFVSAWINDWYRTENSDLDIVIPHGTTKDSEFGYRYGQGTNILRAFYRRHARERIALERNRTRALHEDGSEHLKGKKKKDKLSELQLVPANKLFPISELHIRNTHFNGFSINGVIDRVGMFGDDFVIMDYKTGKMPAAPGCQLTFYYIAAEQIFGKPPVACFLYNLGTMELEPVMVTDKSIDRLRTGLEKNKPALILLKRLRDLKRKERTVTERNSKTEKIYTVPGMFGNWESEQVRSDIKMVKGYLSLENLGEYSDKQATQEYVEPIPSELYDIRDALIESWGEPMDRIVPEKDDYELVHDNIDIED